MGIMIGNMSGSRLLFLQAGILGIIIFMLIIYQTYLSPSAVAAEKWNHLIIKAKEEASAKLIDPSSAQFSEIKKGKIDGVVCGWINRKNVFGGYAGRERFVYVSMEQFPITMVRMELMDMRATLESDDLIDYKNGKQVRRDFQRDIWNRYGCMT